MDRLRRRSLTTATNNGHEFTGEELEFLQAIERYKRREVLHVLKGMGYRKMAEVQTFAPGPQG